MNATEPASTLQASSAFQKQPSRRPLVLAALMLGMFMSSIEATIVATAMPSIVSALGGFSLFSWVFSAFLLMQAITIPLYGKLSDLFGRKPIYIIGACIFLIGSVLCGFAGSMTLLIVFRLIQGLGAGAVQPIATTIVGDMYTLEERGKIQGYLASVWGFSSIIGPLAGGFFVEYIHWSWVFWVNIPIGIVSIIMLALFLKEQVGKKKPSIDYTGSGLLLISISALMYLLIRSGVAWPWLSSPTFLLLAVFAAGMGVFIVWERRAKDPVMPLYLWKDRLISTSNLASLATGMLMIGISTFLPTYVQGVLERSPTTAGFTLAMMSIGWPLASTIGGKYLVTFGFRKVALTGGAVLIVGTTLFLLLKPEYGVLLPGIGAFLIGVGMGLSNTSFIVGIQSSVDWKTRGVATASNMFMRMLGTTIGASLLGSVLNSRMHAQFQERQGEVDMPLQINLTDRLLLPEDRAQLPSDVVKILQDSLTTGLHSVYIGLVLFAAIAFLLIILMPKPQNKR